MVGPPNKEVANFLKRQFVKMFKCKDDVAYIDGLFLGKYEWACYELQRTLQEVSAEMVPRTGTSVLGLGLEVVDCDDVGMLWRSVRECCCLCAVPRNALTLCSSVMLLFVCCTSAHCRGRRQVLRRSRCSTVTRSDTVPD